jgi:hypothetical protein
LGEERNPPREEAEKNMTKQEDFPRFAMGMILPLIRFTLPSSIASRLAGVAIQSYGLQAWIAALATLARNDGERQPANSNSSADIVR